MSTIIETWAERVMMNRLPVSEHDVVRCLSPLYRPNTAHIGERYAAYQAVARTGGIFAIEGEGMQELFEQAPYLLMEGLPELPPLPFPRMWIEARTGEGKPGRFLEWPAYNEVDYYALVAIAINERVPGQEWDVWLVSDEQPLLGWVWGRVTVQSLIEATNEARKTLAQSIADNRRQDEDEPPEATEERILDFTQSVDSRVLNAMRRHKAWKAEGDMEAHVATWALLAAEIATANRIPKRPIVFGRTQAKQQARWSGGTWKPAALYEVDLRSAGEEHQGKGSREYHCRWLVRGHWRLTPHGETYVPSKGGMCTWVNGYVKGPIGAPWKGRPVYTDSPTKRKSA